jgi:serine/threonine-protein kinase
LDGLASLHRNNIVHGDIKPANVMIKRTGHAKIIDLGSAFDMDEPPIRRSCTPVYAAVEVLSGDFSTPRSDLASLGFLLVELLAGKPLFNPNQTLAQIIQGKNEILGQLPELLPEPVLRNELLLSFICQLIHPDPALRFSSADDAANSETGASAFLRQLVKGDMASEYQNDLRLWIDELLDFESDHGLDN